MIEVNKNNYAEKIIDHLDGNLSTKESDVLFAFLSLHPELMDEYILLSGSEPIISSGTTAPFKHELKRSRTDVISEEDLNLLLVAQLENIQTSDEQKKLAKILAIDPTINKDITAFKKTILEPDPNIIFPGKNELKHTRTLYPVYYYAAAAIIIILLTLPFMKREHAGETDKIIADRSSQKTSLGVKRENQSTTPGNNYNNTSLANTANTDKHFNKENHLTTSLSNNPVKTQALTSNNNPLTFQTEINNTSNNLISSIDPVIAIDVDQELLTETELTAYDSTEPTAIQENKMATVVSTGNKILEKLFNRKLPVTYAYKENQNVKGYTFAAGGFEFTRSRSKNRIEN